MLDTIMIVVETVPGPGILQGLVTPFDNQLVFEILTGISKFLSLVERSENYFQMSTSFC